jgi:hypothetical protein
LDHDHNELTLTISAAQANELVGNERHHLLPAARSITVIAMLPEQSESPVCAL